MNEIEKIILDEKMWNEILVDPLLKDFFNTELQYLEDRYQCFDGFSLEKYNKETVKTMVGIIFILRHSFTGYLYKSDNKFTNLEVFSYMGNKLVNFLLP
jgi:hypothetical protein